LIVTPETDPGPWLRALRNSHDQLVGIVATLDADGLRRQSYASEWSIAQVLSHLGSQAEIFSLWLDAGLSGGEAPGQEAFVPIWDVWNARSPQEQATESVAANEALVSRLEALSPAELESIRLGLFGMTLDAAGLMRMRLSEHAVHTWDVAVAVDPAARVAPGSVALLIDGLPMMMAWLGKKAADPAVIAVTTTDPAREFTLDTGGVALTPGSPAADGDAASGSLDLTAEALLRLVYGRVDESAVASGEVQAANVKLTDLRTVFPGF
jgi:uncharacterized protein (TIGR03083 family)